MGHTWPYRIYLAKASGKDEDHDRGVGKNSGIARMTFRKDTVDTYLLEQLPPKRTDFW